MNKSHFQRWFIILSVAGVLCLYGWWNYFRPNPERVARQALAALEAKDATALCRLADPEEIQTLHLSPATVDKILHETVWSTEFVQTRHHLMEEVVSVHPDIKGYGVYPRHMSVQPPNPSHPKNFWLICLQNPDGEWHLNLSHVLLDACYSKTGGMDAHKLYYQYAKKYSINGIRSQDGPYQSMERLQKDLRQLFPTEAAQWTQ